MQLTFPTSDQIAAALESLIDTAQRAYDTTDRAEKEERAFWKRQRNAYINAQADTLAGRLPLLSGDSYLMPSASRPGAYHRCWKAGGVWLCSCEAGERGEFHRHTALISAIEVALDMIEAGTVGEVEAMIPEDQGPDNYDDVPAGPGDPTRSPALDPALVAGLVSRLTQARAVRYAA